MVWGVIGNHGIGNLAILDENMNAEIFFQKFVRKLLDSVKNIFVYKSNPFVMQNDSASAHMACRTVACLEQRDISTNQWPSQSPDFNIA